MVQRSRFLTGLFGAIFAMVGGTAAQARPEYARKEAVACQFCHVSGSPGSVNPVSRQKEPLDRNKRGIYYGSHDHSFAGYVEETAPRPKVTAPRFHYVWKEETAELPRRAAVGDVTGDGMPRLILLCEKPDSKDTSTLLVKKWDGKTFVTEFTGEAKAPADRLAVGKFAGAKQPSQIVTADALWSWDGKSFLRRAFVRQLPIIGASRETDGTERVLLADQPQNVLAYRANPAAAGNDLLIDPVIAPTPPKTTWGDMHMTQKQFEQMGVPEEIGGGNLLGIWKIDRYKLWYVYHIKAQRDFDVVGDPNNPFKPKVTFKGAPIWFVAFRDSRTGAEVWDSPKLPGDAYDVVLEDPRHSGRPGFLVLVNGTSTGKGRTFAWFDMDD